MFWHTQGSGATHGVSLHKNCRKFRADLLTFVILTDRDELNKQISDTFEACGCLGPNKAQQYIAASGEDLIQKAKR